VVRRDGPLRRSETLVRGIRVGVPRRQGSGVPVAGSAAGRGPPALPGGPRSGLGRGAAGRTNGTRATGHLGQVAGVAEPFHAFTYEVFRDQSLQPTRPGSGRTDCECPSRGGLVHVPLPSLGRPSPSRSAGEGVQGGSGAEGKRRTAEPLGRCRQRRPRRAAPWYHEPFKRIKKRPGDTGQTLCRLSADTVARGTIRVRTRLRVHPVLGWPLLPSARRTTPLSSLSPCRSWPSRWTGTSSWPIQRLIPRPTPTRPEHSGHPVGRSFQSSLEATRGCPRAGSAADVPSVPPEAGGVSLEASVRPTTGG
jgi:hypothetical protein